MIILFNQVAQCVQILGLQKYDIEHLSDMKYNAVLSIKSTKLYNDKYWEKTQPPTL